MTTAVTLARVPYARRPAPADYDPGWIGAELANVQRALAPQGIRTATANDAPSTRDATVLYDATAAAISVMLPQPAQVKGLLLRLKKIDSSVNAVTLVGTIDGVVNPTLAAQYKSVTIQSDGSTWQKLAAV